MRILCLLLVLVSVGFYLTSCGKEPAYKLAVIDGIASPSDSEVNEYATLLTTLATRYNRTDENIADMAVKCKQIIEDKDGINESSLNILKAVESADPAGEAKPEELFATLARFFRRPEL